MKAFLISDGDDFSEFVFAENEEVAKNRIANREGIDADILECQRYENFDQYAPGPVPLSVLLENGWWFECGECYHHVEKDGCEDCASDDEAPEIVVTKYNVFCSQACHSQYELDRQQREAARETARAEFEKRYSFATNVSPRLGGTRHCKAGCYEKNRYNVIINFRFDGAKYDAEYCAGCGNGFVNRIDLPAWEKFKNE